MFLAHTLHFKVCAIELVPSARLELAQLSPLPPQDSVSTNFTTTAALSCLDCVRCLAACIAFQLAYEFTLIPARLRAKIREKSIISMEFGLPQKLLVRFHSQVRRGR